MAVWDDRNPGAAIRNVPGDSMRNTIGLTEIRRGDVEEQEEGERERERERQKYLSAPLDQVVRPDHGGYIGASEHLRDPPLRQHDNH